MSPSEKKSERIQLLLTPSELQQVDAWRFSQQIGSRCEAIRQLIEAGLGTHSDNTEPATPDIYADQAAYTATVLSSTTSAPSDPVQTPDSPAEAPGTSSDYNFTEDELLEARRIYMHYTSW